MPKITISIFRQIRLTVDQYLSKRAWGTEGAFAEFNSVMLGWIRDTKKVYDSTLFNAFVGTTRTEVGKQNVEALINTATTGLSGEEKARVEAETIAQTIADVFVELNDVSRDYNDYGYLRSYEDSDLMVIMNAKWLNKITKRDLPTIFHKDDLMNKLTQYKLPARYFGTVNTSSGTTGSSNTTVRSLIEKDYGLVHVFPGDLLPNSTAYSANETYTEDGDVICKIIHKNSIPFMSAFEVATSFFNPRSLTENQYLTWGHSDLDYLANYPFITVNAD